MTDFLRWFEYVSPSGVLKPDTDPTDGIFCGGNTDEFVGPDNAGYIGRSLEDCAHANLAFKAHNEPWANEFCSNSRTFQSLLHRSSWAF